MNIYLVDRRGPIGYDVYSCFVVVAKNEEEARKYDPKGTRMDADDYEELYGWTTDQGKITVKLIGRAAPSFVQGEIICVDFNAG